MGVRAQQNMPDLVRNDVADASSVCHTGWVGFPHEYDCARGEADTTAHRSDAITGCLGLGLKLDYQGGRIFGGRIQYIPPLCGIPEALDPEHLNTCSLEDF